MHIHRIFQFLLKCLCFGLLAKQGPIQVMYLALQALNIHDLISGSCHLPHRLADLASQLADLSHTVLVLNLPLLQRALLNLYLLIQQSQLLISANKLCSQDVPLPDNALQLFLLSLSLQLSLLDGALEALHLRTLRLHDIHEVSHSPLCLLLRLLQLLDALQDLLVVFEVAPNYLVVLLADLLLQCSRVVKHDLELSTHITDLLIGLHQIFRVEIPVHADLIIEILLLIALRLNIRNLLLELCEPCCTAS
mmetsp:Transcript_17443/g.38189  ORF Transcript_17443/g.38189 Transcript_17443/m.38189 type:complete len:250 (+) Transcript_17443:425-1174(+)